VLIVIIVGTLLGLSAGERGRTAVHSGQLPRMAAIAVRVVAERRR
jgi:hypothetical protein